MDQRTKNRIRQHSMQGHRLTEIKPKGSNLTMQNLKTGVPTGMFVCTCDWLDRN